MYASRLTQMVVGVFALLGIAALVYLSVRLGNVGIFPQPGYTVYANFDDVSGLKSGDQVQLAGVTIGKVQSISLQQNRAHVAMRINAGIEIDKDAIAAIKTSGIIGDKYVSIALGPGEQNLSSGGIIRQTESAFILEDAIGQLINSSGSGGSKSSEAGSGGTTSTAAGNSSTRVDAGSNSKPGNCNCFNNQTSKKK
ncbi:MAG: outer membrane lipid asymmetry maintenance protein MlaD [Deltaproteobacteria bacterium]|nr:outer membrane lipid asymmetry maintenance protein MlaD [Deltaproteobacteria bacterium]